MKLEKNYQKIYILCPANYRTGGVELLHQLVFTIAKYRDNVYCVYDGIKNKEYKVLDEYKQYVTDYLLFDEIEDNSNNLLIVPEIALVNLRKFKKLDKAVYWESVDNFFFHSFSLQSLSYLKKEYNLFGGIKQIVHMLKNRNQYSFLSPNSLNRKKVKYNFCQSDYALKKCISWKLNNVFMLTDYINDSFLNKKYEEKENIVIYNPAKGYKFTKKIIASAKNINFIPLINYSRDEICKIMEKAKVYMDFGNHPGKDRMPREAAVSGCCIITGIRGSASREYHDVYIPSNYKFDNPIRERFGIEELIHDIFINFSKHSIDFDEYRNLIRKEHLQFDNEVREIFS